ncbi:unnamed protein product [Mesocestoides corti]|uniref:Cadherin domain-containing protein n=2 Tax=Mesocestoides corti TaxID=53468 RepID=A0A0R3U5L5_MESCO|nr:unnamed protein product [Mesocestoides corti]
MQTRVFLILSCISCCYYLVSAKFIELIFHVTEHTEPNKWIGNLFHSISLTNLNVRSVNIESPPMDEWHHLVHIDTINGDIRTASESFSTLDREKICPVEPFGKPVLDCRISLLISVDQKLLVSLHIIVDDVNDSPPVFLQNGQIVNEISLRLPETAEPGSTTVELPAAIDPDLTSANSPVIYNLIGENVPFSLTVSGLPKLIVSSPLDYERTQTYLFFLQACEGRQASHLCSSIQVSVHIDNVNDHKPIFANSTYNAVINEDIPTGTTILTVEATDDDSPPFGNVSYFLALPHKATDQFPFSVDEKTGQVFLSASHLEPKKYSFVVEATDDPNSQSTASRRATTLVVIFVADVNDHSPVIELKPSSNISNAKYTSFAEEFVVELQEEVLDPTVLVYLTVRDNDEGANALCSCRLNNSPFADKLELTKVNQLSPQTSVYRLVANKPIDAEDPTVIQHLIQPVEEDSCVGVAGFLAINVTCTDSGVKPLAAQATVYIALQGRDEYPTKFIFPDSSEIYRLSVPENTLVGTKLMELVVTDQDTGRCVHIWKNLGADEIPVDTLDGALVLTKALDYETSTSLTFTISAAEHANGRQSEQTASATVFVEVVNVNDNRPQLTSVKPFEAKACRKLTSIVGDLFNQTVGCFAIEVEEEAEVGYLAGQLTAFDADTPNTTSGFIFSLIGAYAPTISQKEDKLLTSPIAVTKNGELIVTGRLDRETFNWVNLLISVSDGEESSLSLVRVNLVDINDNRPVWQFPSLTDYHISVSVFAQTEKVISRVQALDADSGILNGALEYGILPQPQSMAGFSGSSLLKDQLIHSLYGAHLFSINSHTGKLSVKQTLPNQTNMPYRLDITATDKGRPPLQSTAHLLISITDKAFTELQSIQPNFIVSSNNLQNDGVETAMPPSSNSVTERSELQGSPKNVKNWIQIIGISVGALTLVFFIAIMAFVFCKRMQGGSRSLYQKSSKPIELQSHREMQGSPEVGSPVHESLLGQTGVKGAAVASATGPHLSAPPASSPLAPSLPVIGIPACSIALSTGDPTQLDASNSKNLPVIVSLAVLPADNRFPEPTEYVVISDGVAVDTHKPEWQVVSTTSAGNALMHGEEWMQ